MYLLFFRIPSISDSLFYFESNMSFVQKKMCSILVLLDPRVAEKTWLKKRATIWHAEDDDGGVPSHGS